MKRSNKRIFLWFLILALIAFAIGAWFGDRTVKEKGYKNLWSFLTTASRNYPKSIGAEVQQLSITIPEKEFAKLEELVEKARNEGVIPRKGNKFRKAELTINDRTSQVELRIKGKLTDHVDGDKWSFRVKVKGESDVLGMKRFSLQHPGTRNYANEWVFHQLAAREGLIALNYQFVNLIVNGDDLGIYALEEHFGQELIVRNGRAPGPILRFDPGLYWQHRLNLMNDVHVLEEYAEFNSANIDTYTEGTVFSDSALSSGFYRAQGLLEGFRNGELDVEEVFDIDLLAKYHALIDLVGGHHSLDWSDVKYYYNPSTELIEPVAYESFSVFPTKKLAGSYRFKGRDVKRTDLHDALFNSKDFFRAYVRELRAVANRDYLDSFFKSIEDELNEQLSILYKEFPYKEFSNAQYYANSNAINTMLSAPQGFHAWMQSIDTLNGAARVTIRLGAIESLPMQVVGIRTNLKEVIPLDSLGVKEFIVPSKKPRSPIEIVDLVFELDQEKVEVGKTKGWRVMYNVLGDPEQQKVTVLPYAYLPEKVDTLSNSASSGSEDAMFVRIPEQDQWVILPGTWKLTEDIVVPEHITLSIGSGVQLDLYKNSSIKVHGLLDLHGSDEDPVRVYVHDNSRGIQAQQGAGVRIRKALLSSHSLHPALTLDSARLQLSNSKIIGSAEELICAKRTMITGNDNVWKVGNNNALALYLSKAIIRNDEISGSGTFLNGSGAYVESTGLTSNNACTVLDLDLSEVVIFSPDLVEGCELKTKGDCQVEFRDLDMPNERLQLELSEQTVLVVNGVTRTAHIAQK